MSLKEQERALFDLIFDKGLRDDFLTRSIDALNHYNLTEKETQDFSNIKPEALRMDAEMRANIVLARICKSYPLSFSLLSSFESGLEVVKQLLDPETMRSDVVDQTVLFGTRLRELIVETYPGEPILLDILTAELTMCWAGANLKSRLIDKKPAPIPNDIPHDWMTRPVRLAPYVSSLPIPLPYQELRSELLPVPEAQLWRHLLKAPTTFSVREKALSHQKKCLLLSKPEIYFESHIDPEVEFKTIELTEGFISLFEHVNGSMSIQELIEQLEEAGAPENILESVNNTFLKLLTAGMLEIIN